MSRKSCGQTMKERANSTEILILFSMILNMQLAELSVKQYIVQPTKVVFLKGNRTEMLCVLPSFESSARTCN